MGTNYYLQLPGESETLHIGKSSFGWCFSLHVIPERGIHDLDDWRPLFEAGQIRDEYGKPRTVQEMIHVITDRSHPSHPECVPPSPEWYRSNHAEPGPNGLARHTVGRGCVKQGSGTWDCIEGDFA